MKVIIIRIYEAKFLSHRMITIVKQSLKCYSEEKLVLTLERCFFPQEPSETMKNVRVNYIKFNFEERR